MLEVPVFERDFSPAGLRLSRIGGGSIGGKAEGLARARRVLERHGPELARLGLEVDVPWLVVLGADFYSEFVERNGLAALLDGGTDDVAIADAFHRAPIPPALVGDLRALAEGLRRPLAIRSSSVLEDALGEPFAGVYGTKMLPANQPDAAGRFRSLLDAVKFVWATTLFAGARAYLAATRHRGAREQMAVVVQEVVGRRHGDRFYPEISAVARSYNFYPAGGALPEQGMLALALGLGKTIVDGEPCWSVSLGRPRAAPPFASPADLADQSQRHFWAIRVGAPPPYDPMAETEFLSQARLEEAEADGALRFAASTFDAAAQRIVPGTGRPGPRVVDFAPILVHAEIRLVEAVRALLAACEEELGQPVEIELALTLPPESKPRLGLLQMRPLVVGDARIELDEGDLEAGRAWLASRLASGNGRHEVLDVVYLDPERFEARHTPAIAREVEQIGRGLAADRRGYLLVGFGRWGSADPWLGVPVRWDQIAGARALVEVGLPGWSPDPSQGSHFFHNLSSFGVLYLAIPPEASASPFWSFLAGQPVVAEGEFVRHVRLASPLTIEVDGRSRRGVVRREAEP